ncbi:uncharacterized protein LOC124148541 isoform X2 [Haliotis rufescens]|uniref:uncharacterized protein LOC124148541 isoform X2 n=1 Tax=Haliotis rufescens TaxID=6454 RepID=UPI00201F72F8|nr:uncharacterized protein LOC124148541 isoform X2 [Haliotis rufescens]
MSDKTRFVKEDGTLLDGKEAEQELAKYDAKSILKELGLKEGTADSDARETNSTKVDTFKGLGRKLKSAFGSRTPTFHDSSPRPDDSSGGDTPEATSQTNQHQPCSSKQADRRRRSSIRDEADETELNKKIAGVSPQMKEDAHQIWKFSKDVEDGVYHFSLDVDSLWKSISEPLLLVQRKINEVANKTLPYIYSGDSMVQTGLDTIETWSDMTQNIKGATEALNNVIKDKTGEVTGFSRNLNDQAQELAKSATSVVENPTLNRVADMSDVSVMIRDMSGTAEHLSTTFNTLVDDMTTELQKSITSFSDMLIKAGEDSGLFSFIKEAGNEICKLLKTVLTIIAFIKENITKFLQKFNGLFYKVFALLGKIVSVIEGVLGLDMELMKEALKNGTIRAADVKVGNVNFTMSSEVKTKSSTVVSGAKVTAGNISAAGKVTDNSRSGHIEATAVDVKAANVDVAVMREGKIKRNLAYLKGANINAGNMRATLVDDREIDSVVVGASAAEVNLGNVEAFGLGRKGTHRHTTTQPSFSAGNVAIGVRRSTGTNIKAGPQFSAGNIDLTIGKPSVSNFLNQLRPGHGIANFTIPFLGGGAGEAGGKSDGEKGSGMSTETAGESTYGLARDTVEFGDRLPQHKVVGTGVERSGSNKEGGSGQGPGSKFRGEGVERSGSNKEKGSGSEPGPGSKVRGEGVERSASNKEKGSGSEHGPGSKVRGGGVERSGSVKEEGSGSEPGPGSKVSGEGVERSASNKEKGSGSEPGPGSKVRGEGVERSGSDKEEGSGSERGPDSKVRGEVFERSGSSKKGGPGPGSEGRGEGTTGASGRGTRKWFDNSNTQESNPSKSTASNTHSFGNGTGNDSQTHRRGQPGQTSVSRSSSNSLLDESADNPFSQNKDSNYKPLSKSDGVKGDGNALGSGVYKRGDGIGENPEDDYQSTVASIVRREVHRKSGKEPKQEQRKETKADEKPKKYSKEELKRILLKESHEELGTGAEAGGGHTGDAKETKTTKKTQRKPKAKPWGEHGNIHGFSTLGTECGKEVKKLGNGIYGFGDE